MKRNLSLLILAITFLAVMISLSYAQPKPEPKIAGPVESEKLKPPIKPGGLSAPDLEARLTIGSRTVEGGFGIIELRGNICNVGPADFVSPPAAPAVAQLTAYDPTKPLKRDNVKVVTSQNITRLNRGACIHMPPILDRIPRFVGWDIRDLRPGECIAQLEFSLSVSPNVPEATTFRPSEDSNSGNNVVKRKVRFKVRCP